MPVQPPPVQAASNGAVATTVQPPPFVVHCVGASEALAALTTSASAAVKKQVIRVFIGFSSSAETTGCSGQSQGHGAVEEPSWSQRGVAHVGGLIGLVLVEQVVHAERDESVALRQPVAQARVEHPEVAMAILEGRRRVAQEDA